MSPKKKVLRPSKEDASWLVGLMVVVALSWVAGRTASSWWMLAGFLAPFFVSFVYNVVKLKRKA